VGPLDKISLDISIVLGRSRMPIHQLLRMGRGAVIELDSEDDDEVEILANDMPVARGVLVVTGSSISVEIKNLLRRPTGETSISVAAGQA
jgi:flagellar motor switch protein FliN